MHYSKNPELNVAFAMSNIQWTNIQVSAFEVICWHEAIYGMMRDFRQPGSICDQWHKYWVLKCYQNQAYIQILQYMKNHVANAIRKIRDAKNINQ